MFKRSLLSLVMVLSCTAALASEASAESTGYFKQATEFVGKCLNSKAVTETVKMVNPCAYVDAFKKAWNATEKGALATLWDDHKFVIAGPVVLTAAAVVAYQQGWFSKAKTWVQEKLA